MEDFLKNIFPDGESINPPEVCQQSFSINFSEAINVEWSKKGNEYEAVFYRNNLEHVALFSESGGLIEYRMILPSGSLPEMIKKLLDGEGEIMNQVLVNKGNTIQYEAIIRDQALNRYLIELTDLGQVIRKHIL